MTATPANAGAPPAETSISPARAGLVLGSLIAVAAVANLGLAVANVALPSIGQEFDASQTALNLSPSATRSGSPRRCSTWARSATATGGS